MIDTVKNSAVLHAIMEAAVDAIIVADQNGTILQLSLIHI